MMVTSGICRECARTTSMGLSVLCDTGWTFNFCAVFFTLNRRDNKGMEGEKEKE